MTQDDAIATAKRLATKSGDPVVIWRNVRDGRYLCVALDDTDPKGPNWQPVNNVKPGGQIINVPVTVQVEIPRPEFRAHTVDELVTLYVVPAATKQLTELAARQGAIKS